MRAWLGFAASGAVLVGVGAWVAAELVPGAARAVWVGAGLAYAIQLVAFGVLVAVRRRGMAFLAAWGGGTLLRLGAVLAAGIWVARSAALPPGPLLLSLAGFLFLLLLLEPVFFRTGMRS